MSEIPVHPVQCVAITEDMTIYQAGAHKEALLAALDTADELEVDLSAVGEMDSAGLQVLLLVKREAARRGKRACLHRHSPAVCEVIDFFHLAAQLGDPILIAAEQG